MSNEFTIQAALYTALSGASAVTDLVSTVVDFGPSEADASAIYPYVAMGDLSFVEEDTKTNTGFDVAIRIATWGDNGAKQVRDIQGAIYDTLHLQSVSVTGFTHVNLRREQSIINRAASGAFQGVCDYRWLLFKS